MTFFPDSSTFLIIGSVAIRWYAVTILLGIAAAYFLIAKHMKKHGYTVEYTDELLILCMISGFLGGRLFWVLEHLPEYLKYIPYIFAIGDGGFDLLGIAVGIWITAFLYTRHRYMSILRTMDIVIPALILFAVITRIGRSFATPSLWICNAMDLCAFLILWFVLKPYRPGRRRGDLAAVGMMFIAVSRLAAFVFKWDPNAAMILIPAIIVMFMGIALYIMIRKRRPTKPIILFDLDGTLMDSHHMVIQCFNYLFMKYSDPANFTPELQKEVFGTPLRDMMVKLFPDQNPDQMVEEYRKYQSSFSWRGEVELYPHTKETLDTLWKDGYLLGLVSTRLTGSLELWLRQLDLSYLFGTILGRDQLSRPKPKPDGILYAGKKLKRGHDSCIYVGDNVSDVVMAKNAGVYAVAFLSDPEKKEVLEAEKPNRIITDLSELLELVQEDHEWSYEKK